MGTFFKQDGYIWNDVDVQRMPSWTSAGVAPEAVIAVAGQAGSERSMDKRWKQLGDILVNYSTAVKPGERVMIIWSTGDAAARARRLRSRSQGRRLSPSAVLSRRCALLRYGNVNQISWGRNRSVWHGMGRRLHRPA